MKFENMAAVSILFVSNLMKILDEAAKGEDLYLTFGTTRDKSSFTASISLDGNRQSVYEAQAIVLVESFSELLTHLLDEGEEQEELEDSNISFDKEN